MTVDAKMKLSKELEQQLEKRIDYGGDSYWHNRGHTLQWVESWIM